jgi:hypothetical protein
MTEAQAAPPAAAPSAPTAPPAPAAAQEAAAGRETLPDISGGRSEAARRAAAEARAARSTDPAPPPPEGETPPPAAGAAQGEEKPAEQTRAERRRAALDLQREQRALAKQRRELEEARRGFSTLEQAAKSGDPDAILRAMGYDPDRYQHDRILQTLKAGAAPDPVEEQIKAAVAPLLERIQRYEQQTAAERATQAALAHTTQMVEQHVLPLFTGESAAKHEALLSQFDGEKDPARAAADYVFAVGKDHYEKTGEQVLPAEIARRLEEHVSGEKERELERLAKLSKFKGKFAPPAPAKKTLTNKDGPTPGGDPLRLLNPLGTREEQNAAALAAVRARQATG